MLRFFGTSCASTVVDYATAATGVYLGLSPYAALVLGVVLGAVLGYLLLTYWVFPVTRAGESSFSPRRMGGFALGIGLIYVVRAACVWLWGLLPLGPSFIYVGMLLSYGVSLVANFLFQKYVAFRPTRRAA